MKKGKIIVILGPTASGKSVLAVRLARRFGGEVISADSRQVYKGLDIGTGKISKKEMGGIPHHLLDLLEPKRTFSAWKFKKKAEKKIGEILKREKLPIICGGTGFYIQTITDNLSLPETKPDKKLRAVLEKLTAEELFKKLKKIDRKRAENIDVKNKRRLIRALEIVKAKGQVPNIAKTRPRYEILEIGLAPKVEILRKNINERLCARMKAGMVSEAKRLHLKGLSWKRMMDLGLEYEYLAKHLKGETTKEEMPKILERKIWQYAKRQITWWKRDKRIKWFEPGKYREIEKEIKNFLKSQPK